MAATSDDAPRVNEWQRVGGRAGGTITAIAGADQGEGARRLFAGTMSGVYVSDDGGDSWRISNRNLTSPYVHALVASPAVTEDGTVFVGVVGGGAFKSFDRGDTWNKLAFWSTMPNVVGIGLSPAYATDRMAFLGSDADGVFRSTNGGRSWNPSSNGLTGLSVQAVAVSPNFTNDQTVYAGIVDGGLCRSTDAGRTWTQLGKSTVGTATVQAVALSPAFKDARVVVIGTEEHGLWRSTDGGRRWAAVEDLASQSINAVAMSPSFGEDQLVVAGTGDAGVLVSTDGGENLVVVFRRRRGGRRAQRVGDGRRGHDDPMGRHLRDGSLSIDGPGPDLGDGQQRHHQPELGHAGPQSDACPRQHDVRRRNRDGGVPLERRR